jgi:hypothetical protein
MQSTMRNHDGDNTYGDVTKDIQMNSRDFVKRTDNHRSDVRRALAPGGLPGPLPSQYWTYKTNDGEGSNGRCPIDLPVRKSEDWQALVCPSGV